MAEGEAVTLPLGKAVFIDDVAAYMEGKKADEAILELQQRLSQYKYIEAQTLQRRQRLQEKLPSIQHALDVVDALLAKADSDDPLAVDFELSDGVFAKGALQRARAVNLWLGAGVMVEYPLEEAREELARNLDTCQAGLATLAQDLALLKDSITTSEVSIARLFNWDVEVRRAAKGGGGGK